jgi:molybdate transport system substrate-binding protein
MTLPGEGALTPEVGIHAYQLIYYNTMNPLCTFRRAFALFLLALALAASPAWSQTVAVAASAKAVLAELAGAFRARTGKQITTVVAASGVLAAQLRNGAPFDLFLSADTSYPMVLWRAGAVDTPRVYAFGRLILWSRSGVAVERGLGALTSPSVRSIAIANPLNAPFGQAAMEALRRSGLAESLRAKIVFGESIAQVNQYIDSRVADAGLTSASATLGITDPGAWAPVDARLYPPIPQAAAVVLRGAPDGERSARMFLAFLASDTARAIIARYGYGLP